MLTAALMHLDPASHDRSIDKAARFAAHGALYLPTKPSMLRLDRPGTIRMLKAAYEQASAPATSSAVRRPVYCGVTSLTLNVSKATPLTFGPPPPATDCGQPGNFGPRFSRCAARPSCTSGSPKP